MRLNIEIERYFQKETGRIQSWRKFFVEIYRSIGYGASNMGISVQ